MMPEIHLFLAMKNLVIIFLGIMLLLACREISSKNVRNENAQVDDGVAGIQRPQTRNHKLRYVFATVGGTLGFFDDSSVSACPKCRLCWEDIGFLILANPHARYVSADSFLVTDNGEVTDTMFLKNDDYEVWAMIDHKWTMAVDSCK